MAKYNFNLREPNSLNLTAIHLIIRYKNQRLVFPTGESIDPKYWTGGKIQKVKETRQFPEYPEFNIRLANIKTIANNIFRKYQNDNNQQSPTIIELKALLKKELNGTPQSDKLDLFSFIDHYIEQSKPTKSRITISWHKMTLKRLKQFQKKYNRRIDFDIIDLDFYHDFCEYLTTDLKHATNTIGKHIQNLKVFLNEATDRGLNTNLAFKSKRFKKLSEETDSIYLNEKELEEFYKLDLSDNKKLERVRDLFIVGCWTGLRFSDFTNIQSENIKGDFIEIKTRKTGEKVVIPIHRTIKEIMKKYKGQYPNSLPPSISNVKMNAYLKEVGQLVECLHVKTSTSITKGGIKRITTRKKYELVTSHTARRSMATNLYLDGVPSITIQKITGHKTEKAFMKYIKITPKENAKILQMHWQKKQGLKIV